jgi:hypothetical protein
MSEQRIPLTLATDPREWKSLLLGAALARMTLEEVIRGVSELAPELSADPDDIEWVQRLGRSPSRLPVKV